MKKSRYSDSQIFAILIQVEASLLVSALCLNNVIRKVIKKRKLFPTDDSAKKVVYLAIQDASKKWTM